MKILILTNSLGGLYHFRKEVVMKIIENNQLIISAPFDDTITFFNEVGCQFIPTQFNRKGTNPIKDFYQIFKYVQILNKVKPDAVLTYTIKPNIYGGIACRWTGVPQIANITGLGTAVETPGWMQKLTIFLYKIGLRKTHTVFFQNRANRDFCQAHRMVRGHHMLIPGSGVNLEHHHFQEYPPENTLRFIFISRLVKAKGIDHYLEAAEHIKKTRPDIEFHILGYCEDNYQKRIDKLQQDGIIIYHGKQMDVRPFFAQAHCTIHPSFYPEGMSNVLLESCANGRPIITTDRPGCGEIVDDGVNGFIVRQRDTNDLIEKIEKFISLPYETKKLMGKNARLMVEKEFDRNIVVKAYLKEIETLKPKDEQ